MRPPIDNVPALEILRQTSAALDYAHERGVVHRAVKWFQDAANHGNSSGFYNLATKYERGEGVKLSLDTALELYRKSADLGNAEARRRLAQLKPRK